MTQEHKKLLIKDLCARLPYGIKIEVTYSKDSGSSLRDRLCCKGINILDTNILGLFQQSEIYIKPYLFPLSSMTEEQEKEYNETLGKIIYTDGTVFDEDKTYHTFDFLNKNHFDYRGLIDMGLANDATGLNIY